jgi:hypothetical protein
MFNGPLVEIELADEDAADERGFAVSTPGLRR